MSKSAFIDFRAVKAALTMEQVLQHYGLLDQFKRGNDSLSGPCPIHRGENPTQFRVSLSKNVWNCFSECKHGGNVLDFIARMDNVSIHAAALRAIEWFGLDPDQVHAEGDAVAGEASESRASREPAAPPRPVPRSAPAVEAKPENAGPNPPLKFRLDKLEREHPYLAERGLTLETVIDFGVGFCSKGLMAGRIAIPIHNPEGQVVAYAGRCLGEPAGDTAKYKLPPGFRKSLELFNLDRARKEPEDTPLIVVEGFFDAMKLHQLGHRRVVALMGCTLSHAQEELLRRHTTQHSQILVMLDEDEAGRSARDEIAARLAKFAFVRIHAFGEEGTQPEHLTAEALAEVFT